MAVARDIGDLVDAQRAGEMLFNLYYKIYDKFDLTKLIVVMV